MFHRKPSLIFRKQPLAVLPVFERLSPVKRFKLSAILAAALMASATISQAVLTGFTDYALGGTTASWDIFYGSNYQPVFNFPTGTAGNPILNSTEELNLNVVVNSYIPGPPTPSRKQATGPIDTDGSTIPGNRDQFYTFFSDVATWSILGYATGAMDTLIFQIAEIDVSALSMTNVMLNGSAVTPTFNDTTDVGTFTWSGLGLSSGDSFNITWNTNTHQSYDAFQIQTDVVVVPEPTAAGLLVASLGVWLIRRRQWRLGSSQGLDS